MEITRKDTILQNPITLIEQGCTARDVFYDTIGYEYDADDRQVKHAQPRSAFGNALTKVIGDTLTADVLGKDRTTVIHYKRTHESNMEGWDGYATFYETAEYIVNSYFNGSAKIDRIRYIDKMVNKLLMEKIQIQSQINEQLQIQDH
jgi:hypothetical protein